MALLRKLGMKTQGGLRPRLRRGGDRIEATWVLGRQGMAVAAYFAGLFDCPFNLVVRING